MHIWNLQFKMIDWFRNALQDFEFKCKCSIWNLRVLLETGHWVTLAGSIPTLMYRDEALENAHEVTSFGRRLSHVVADRIHKI